MHAPLVPPWHWQRTTHSVSPKYNMQNIEAKLWLITLIKKRQFPQFNYPWWQTVDVLLWNIALHRKRCNRNGLKRSCSLHFTLAHRKTPPCKQDHAIGIVSEPFKRQNPANPFRAPSVKSFKQAIVGALGTFSLLALFSIFLGCSFHGWLHTIHQKCFSLLPPTHTFFSSSSFSLDSPPSLIYTRLTERLCSSLQ